jgi:hypothetical protein
MSSNHRLEAAKFIFNVIWAKIVPDCFLEYMIQAIDTHEYDLKVIPFLPIDCKYTRTFKSKFDKGTLEYECGYWESEYHENFLGFKERTIHKGKHWNLHSVIHCLHNLGIEFDKIQIEERFRGGIVDVEAEIEKEKKYIVVELGELSNIGKFFLTDDEIVEEFWFSDKDKFIFSLSRGINSTNKEPGYYFKFISNYHNKHCKQGYRPNSFDCDTYGAVNCYSYRRLLEEFP